MKLKTRRENVSHPGQWERIVWGEESFGVGDFLHIFWFEGEGRNLDVPGELLSIFRSQSGEVELDVRPIHQDKIVTISGSEVQSIDAIDVASVEETATVTRERTVLPETVREHLVRFHGYTVAHAAARSVDSLLLHHRELHRQAEAEGTTFGHIHGLSDGEADLFDSILRRQGIR